MQLSRIPLLPRVQTANACRKPEKSGNRFRRPAAWLSLYLLFLGELSGAREIGRQGGRQGFAERNRHDGVHLLTLAPQGACI